MQTPSTNSVTSRLLVVEESAAVRQQIRDHITTGQLEIVEAEDTETAWNLLRTEPVTLLLTDRNPSGGDGLAFTKKVTRQFGSLPIIFMTEEGSEEIAMQALKAGASSYLPKAMLEQELDSIIQRLLNITRETQRRQEAIGHLRTMQVSFQTGNDVTAIHSVTGYIQEQIRLLSFCDETELTRISTAVHEALINAVEHGNLELDSSLRELEDSSYSLLSLERANANPYRERKVSITLEFTPDRLQFIVKDDGSGFDPDALPTPEEIRNQERVGGRGLMLIRSFMDEVWFNSQGNEITLVKYSPQSEREPS